MGSTGSGSFTDYSNYKKNAENANIGGTSGEDQCARALSTLIEEVSICDYYKTKGDVPPIDTEVYISFDVRLKVMDANDKLCIGLLPTKFNYLRACMEGGFSYAGIVSSSSHTPMPSVTIDIQPQNGRK